VGVGNDHLPDNDDPSNIEVDAPEQPHRSEGTVMAKSKVKPGWVGPLKQAKDGKQPYYCEYGDWSSGDKLRHKCGAAGKKKDAEAEWIKFRASMESKTHTPNSTRTFGDALDDYLEWCEQRWRLKQLSGASVKSYEARIRLHIRPALGHIRLVDVDTHIVQKFLNDMAGDNGCLHTSCDETIKEVFKRSVYLDHLAMSPYTRKPWIVPPRAPSNKSIPTIEEGRALWHALQERTPREHNHTYFNRVAAVAMAMFGGCERGVVAALMWDDIDWIGGVVNLRRSWSPSRDGIKAPKNKYRVRTIPMAQEIRTWLSMIWERDARPSTGYVFHTHQRPNGTADGRAAVYAAINKNYLAYAIRNAGFGDRWSFHELRHYAGSIWLEAGASIEDVARMLGHSNTNTTRKYYIHYFQKQEAERHRFIADKVSVMHQLPGSTMALPSPMREKCEIDGEVIDISNED
jgi:integrase